MTGTLDYYVGVDLAERYSAAVGVDSAGNPIFEELGDFEAKSKPVHWPTHFEAVRVFWVRVANQLELHREMYGPEKPKVGFAVEDPLINAYSQKMMAAGLLTIRGSLLTMMWLSGVDPVLVKALDWQRHFGYDKETKKQLGASAAKKWATQMCEELGFEPKLDTYAKQKTDLRDAFLIARWLREVV